MKRNDYFDFLKGFCILSVIVGHSIAAVSGLSILYNIIYSFHMPLLFFVSGCIEEQSRQKYEQHTFQFLLKRARGLLIPYIAWTLIYGLHPDLAFSVNCKNLWRQLLGQSQTGLWFLAVLFALKCTHAIYWYIQKRSGQNTFPANLLSIAALEFLIIALALFTRASYITNMVSFALPYFCGVLFINEISLRRLFANEWTAFLSAICYIVVFQIFDFHDTVIYMQGIRIFLSLCIILLCCKHMGQWQKNHRWKEMLCLFGRYSLEIYLIHGFFLDYSAFIQKADSVWLEAVSAIALSIILAYTCIFISRIIGLSQYLYKILFGK